MFFNRTGIETEDLEFNTRKLDLENDEEYKKLLVDYNQKNGEFVEGELNYSELLIFDHWQAT